MTEVAKSKFTFCNELFAVNDDGHFTFSSTEQKRVEDLVRECTESLENAGDGPGSASEATLVLQRALHANYALKNLKNLPALNMSLDASRPWLTYWLVHSLNLLGVEIPRELESGIIEFLKTCTHPDGGYAGGPGQYPHLATTYGAVMTLASLKSEQALKSIDRASVKKFLLSMKQSNGGFQMHKGGEVDIRGSYCAISVASLLNILCDKLREGAAEWIVGCQTYEGGFGGEPGVEAHGGYTFCGVAALILLGRFRLADSDAVLQWICNRQMRFEGGFQGRTNKLVDGCYSFWQGAVFPILETELVQEERQKIGGLLESRMLEEYVLVACQDPAGGLRDKPGARRDAYHTCYCLSGLSVAQSYSTLNNGGIAGGESNRVESINPLFNITTPCERFSGDFFAKQNAL